MSIKFLLQHNSSKFCFCFFVGCFFLFFIFVFLISNQNFIFLTSTFGNIFKIFFLFCCWNWSLSQKSFGSIAQWPNIGTELCHVQGPSLATNKLWPIVFTSLGLRITETGNCAREPLRFLPAQK